MRNERLPAAAAMTPQAAATHPERRSDRDRIAYALLLPVALGDIYRLVTDVAGSA